MRPNDLTKVNYLNLIIVFGKKYDSLSHNDLTSRSNEKLS